MSPRIVLAGGGTAGHIEPALAVADEILRLQPSFSCEFLGTNGALEELLVPKRGYQLHKVKKVVLPRKLSVKTLLFPFNLLISISQAVRATRGASLVIGFGGYVSAPAYLAAVFLRIPIVIHEANAKPGWANRLGRPFAKQVAVNFEAVRRTWPGSVLTGMPIRSSLTAIAKQSDRNLLREQNCKAWGFDSSKPVIAIFGGSQGSAHINQVVADSLSQLRGFQIIHALGMNNPLPQPREGYLPMSYFHDMAAIYASADLLITRSGAVTCSELASLGKYAMLIPLSHGNGEQLFNAQALEKEGSAMIVSNDQFSAQWFIENLPKALSNAMNHKPMPSGINLDAAGRIAHLALSVLHSSKKGSDEKRIS